VEHFCVKFADPSCHPGFEISSGKTDRQTDKHMNGGENLTTATAVGVSNDILLGPQNGS